MTLNPLGDYASPAKPSVRLLAQGLHYGRRVFTSLTTERLLLLSHTGVTLIMVGIMWTVQLVVYPQFRLVPAENFVNYITTHSTKMVTILGIFGPLEVVLALLLWVMRPEGVSGTVSFVSGLVLVVGWVATGFWYAPLHGQLQTGGFDAELIDRLLVTNWIRTMLWSIRGVLALSFL